MDGFRQKLSLFDRALAKLHADKVNKLDYRADKADLGYKSAESVFNDMQNLFDRTVLDLQNEMQNLANRNLKEFNIYAKTVGSSAQELTAECIERQRAIDLKV